MRELRLSHRADDTHRADLRSADVCASEVRAAGVWRAYLRTNLSESRLSAGWFLSPDTDASRRAARWLSPRLPANGRQPALHRSRGRAATFVELPGVGRSAVARARGGAAATCAVPAFDLQSSHSRPAAVIVSSSRVI